MKKIILISFGCLLVLIPGLLQGFWVGRWHSTEELAPWVQKLEDVPRNFPYWEEVGDHSIDEKILKSAEFLGYLSRTYQHSVTGQRVSVLIVCGRPGPISVHTPDVCYQGIGFAMGTEETRTLSTKGGENKGEFRTAEFVKTNAAGTQALRIFWGWNSQGAWKAPNYPRWTFGGAPALYKMYLITQINPQAKQEIDPCVQFYEEVGPALNRALFPTS